METLFQIFFEHHGLFKSHQPFLPRSWLGDVPIQSLDSFLKESGIDGEGSGNRQVPAKATFGILQNHAMALGLARCLQDFFDSDTGVAVWNSSKVYLVTPRGRDIRDAMIYVAFRGENSHAPLAAPYIGHPLIVAFAKLLLEIGEGRAIDLSGCRNDEERWGRLCVHAQNSGQSVSGLYGDAIKSLLYLHVNFPKDVDPATELRKHIRTKVVSQLEAAANPISSTDKKRRREGLLDSSDDNDSRGTRSEIQSSHGPLGRSSPPCSSKRPRLGLESVQRAIPTRPRFVSPKLLKVGRSSMLM